jgi:hypothetical protein
MAECERATAQRSSHGRATANGGAGPVVATARTQTRAQAPSSAGTRSADDIELSRWEDTVDRLGGEPRKFNIEVNDSTHSGLNAHTKRDHGPQVPLHQVPAVKTIEGRIYGGHEWHQPKNGSHRWTDPSTMNRTINDYVRKNWDVIRANLAIHGRHTDVFDAGHRVGEGFVNRNMGGLGPRDAQYSTTSVVRITIRLVPGSDPPEPFIVTAFPSALG